MLLLHWPANRTETMVAVPEPIVKSMLDMPDAAAAALLLLCCCSCCSAAPQC